MIVRLTGKLAAVGQDNVLIDVNNVGYEVWMPQFTLRTLTLNPGDDITVYTYQYLEGGGNNMIPRLTGFISELDREFFFQLTRVQDVGPRKALAAMSIPTSRLARAIIDSDLPVLRSIKGVGPKMAAKIVATLSESVGKFALMQQEEGAVAELSPLDISTEAEQVLVSQLGFKQHEARDFVRRTLDENKKIQTTDELLTAIFRRIGAK